MTATASPALSQGHPCFGCAVRQISVCGILEDEELRKYRETGSTVRHDAGATIFFEGDRARSVFTLVSGTLLLSKLLPDGRRQIAGFVFPGDFLGITMEEEHAFTVEAITPVELCSFSRTRFDAFIEAHPRMEKRLYALAAHELAAARQQLVLLGRKTAAERVASFLLMLASRCRKEGGPAGLVRLPMPRNDIADYLGLRIETVSRELTALKSAGLIRLDDLHTVRLLDIPRLEALAEG